MHTCLHIPYDFLHVCVYLLPCMWMGVYLYGCVYECLYVCVCVFVCCVCVFLRVFVCMIE